MSLTIGIIRGDGIGPEVMASALEVLAAAGFGPGLEMDARLEEMPMGLAVYRQKGVPLEDEVLERMKGCDALLLSAVMSPPEPDPGYRSGLLRIRRELDLFANLRPARSLPGVPGAVPGAGRSQPRLRIGRPSRRRAP